jgi:hypothetical protein
MLKGARAVFNGGAGISCTVKNLSEKGALLGFESIVGLPPVFTLVLDDGSLARRCVIEHRHPRGVGVQFLEPTDHLLGEDAPHAAATGSP